MKKLPETTVPHIEVVIAVTSTCPCCGKRAQRAETLSYESLVTGNTTQRASYWADEMVREVNAEIKHRGWDDVRCGACRDERRMPHATEEK